MADIRDLFYHGVREQFRRVLVAMGPDRIDAGLTAFEDGSNDWSNCFFARAYPELKRAGQHPEYFLRDALGFKTIIPIRIVWHTFDNLNHYMTPKQMREFVTSVRDEQRPEEVMALIRSLDIDKFQSTPVEVQCT